MVFHSKGTLKIFLHPGPHLLRTRCHKDPLKEVSLERKPLTWSMQVWNCCQSHAPKFYHWTKRLLPTSAASLLYMSLTDSKMSEPEFAERQIWIDSYLKGTFCSILCPFRNTKTIIFPRAWNLQCLPTKNLCCKPSEEQLSNCEANSLCCLSSRLK